MSDAEKETVPMAECGACRTVIPLDSTECPECQTKFTGVSEEALGECGACNQLVPLESTRCPECGVVFVADDVVDILRGWINETGINIRKLFEKFDDDGNGTIDSQELKQGLLSLNLADLPPSQVDRLVQEIDADDNGVIDLDEFESILMGESQESEVESLDSGQEDAPEDESVEPDAQSEDDSGEPEDLSENEAMEHEEIADDEGAEVGDSGDGPGEDEADDAAQHADEVDHASEEEDIEHAMDDEDFDLEDDEAYESKEAVHPLAAIADMMDEHGISAQRMFNELDRDGNGMISLAELTTSLDEKYSDMINIDDVKGMLGDIDEDGDGSIDITEFIGSLESLDDHEEALEQHAPVKEFPSPWQLRMMSKAWSENIWPIIHVGFGILIALVLVNALVGPVDGSGGAIEYMPIDGGVVPSDLEAGDIYPCDEKYQDGGCSNSLTILAGENGASSMPKGLYWDGVLLLVLSVAGMCGSLFTHLVKAPSWRARMKAMKEYDDDKSDAEESALNDEGDQEFEESEESEELEEESIDDDEEDVSEDEDDEESETEEEDEEDAIDIGSHIGLMLEDEEVYGTILEFDDDEGTVTIEEDGTGDLVTGYQDDMFLE